MGRRFWQMGEFFPVFTAFIFGVLVTMFQLSRYVSVFCLSPWEISA
jgi:hypothetical protein